MMNLGKTVDVLKICHTATYSFDIDLSKYAFLLSQLHMWLKNMLCR